MKTVTISVLVLYTGLVALLNMHHVERVAIHSENTHLAINEGLMKVSFYSTPSQQSFQDSLTLPTKKRYRIFFKNRSSKKLEVAVRFKTESGEWTINEPEILKPGEEQEMGISYSNTYFYHASSSKGLNKKALATKFRSGLHEDAMHRLGFTKQDIWECYSTDTCNAFAVFE
uniref:hypothetical protein n=1 Tax=Roseivirga sp. TaxID=1964215 RepID=UPI0040479938